MMRGRMLLTALALSLIFAGAALAQNAPEKKVLVVNGRTAAGAVVQIDGPSYMDVDTFARIMNATASYEPGRVILAVPVAEAGAKPERTAPGLSKDFAKAGISQLAEMREWKAAIASAIRSGVAGGNWLGPWLNDYRVRADGSLSQTSLAAKTESDQRALQLLKNEFTYLGEWDSNTQATHPFPECRANNQSGCGAERSASSENLSVRQFSYCDASRGSSRTAPVAIELKGTNPE